MFDAAFVGLGPLGLVAVAAVVCLFFDVFMGGD